MNTGELILFETGEYSDYAISGVCRVLRDFDPIQVAQDFREAHKGMQRPPDETTFLAWMTRAGYIADEDCTRWHIGSYGRVNPERPERFEP